MLLKAEINKKINGESELMCFVQSFVNSCEQLKTLRDIRDLTYEELLEVLRMNNLIVTAVTSKSSKDTQKINIIVLNRINKKDGAFAVLVKNTPLDVDIKEITYKAVSDFFK